MFSSQKKKSDNNWIIYLVAIAIVAAVVGVGAIILVVLGSLSSLDPGILGTTTISSANNNINNNSAQRSINNNNNDMTMTPSGNHIAAATTTSIVIPSNSPGSNPMRMAGMIASIQQNDKNQPAWIIAGHWWLESDRPLTMINSDEDTSDTATTTTLKPHITNFTALIYAIADADGTSFHTYKLSNFAQTSITTQKDTKNSVTIYGTFTLTSEEEKSINNVPAYISIINNKIELWIKPPAEDTQAHLGPTTITGIVSMAMT